MSGFVSEKLVFVCFDGADDHINCIVFHVEPGHIAGLVLIVQQGFRPKLQVVF